MNTEAAAHTALVLCGGGARGAMQVGFYQAIIELGLSFDLVIGSSVGALNGALIAADMPPAELAQLWRRLRKRDVLAWNWRGLRGERGGLYTFAPLRHLLHEVLPIRCFEELKHPLIITTTNLQTGQPCYHERQGDLIEPVIASMSLPGAFPPVWIAGHQHVDGGVADNVPFDKALDRGARELLMISCTCCPQNSTVLASPLKILLRSFMIALDTKYQCSLQQHTSRGIHIQLVRPHFSQSVGLLDFEHADELIDVGYRATLATFRTLRSNPMSSALQRLEGVPS